MDDVSTSKSVEEDPNGSPPPTAAAAMNRGRLLLLWLAGFATLATITATGSMVRLNAATASFAFLVAILLFSVRGSARLGIAMSLLATACFNFFFLPPLHNFTIADPANWVALIAFLLTSIVVNRLVIAARTQAAAAVARRRELETLYALSIDLFAATNRVGALGEAAGRALRLLGAAGGGLVLYDGSFYRQKVVCWSGAKGDEVEDVIAGVGRHREALSIPSPFGTDFYLPLILGGKVSGALVVRGNTASTEALESAGRLVALAVEREHFIEENTHLQALKESDALKTSLLRAVSHDLTTPLTAIIIQTQALKRLAGTTGELGQSVESIATETNRLRRRIDNLLAMARLEAGRYTPRPEPTPAADLFRLLRDHLPNVFAEHPISIEVAPDVPDVFVDPSLALEMIANLLENAHRAAPPDSPISLMARRHPLDPKKVRLEVLDRGPGLIVASAAHAEEDEPITFVASSDVAQRGLGLEIARGLAAASGGTVSLSNRPDGGAIAHIDLPAADLPVVMEEE